MATSNIEQKALGLLNTFERAGKTVKSVTIEGRKIELVFNGRADSDEFERIDMRYDKA